MGKTSKGGSKSTSHQIFKDKARNRVDDLQGMVNDLQFARKENRTGDVAVLEERMNQMLHAWKAELNEPSPASSQNDGSLGSFSSDLFRLLVDDDVTSELTPPTNTIPDLEINAQSIQAGDNWDFHEFREYFVNQAPPEQEFHGTDQFKDSFSGQHTAINKIKASAQLDYHQYNVHYDMDHNLLTNSDVTQCGESVGSQVSSLMCIIDPPSAFLGPKCALWDCLRPAKGFEGCQDYCDRIHADLAKKEGPPGSTPVMRCGGIDLKDDVLFAALTAKTQGKDVGIPECEGAATTKSPWNAPELFNFVIEGETVREWFFFEKPRRAFGSGNRKQRSFPDYSGRGWHESRKQMMKELGGLKRFYYMDPQPLQNLELHLYVYESSNTSDVCALYRMELKLVDGKKTLKGKVSDNSLAAFQKQNSRLTAEFPADDSRSSKVGENIFLNDVEYTFGAPNQNVPQKESCFYGDYFVNQTLHEHGSQGFGHCKDAPTGMQYFLMNNLEVTNQLDYHQFDLHKEFENSRFTGFVGSDQCEEDNKHRTSGFMRPKCALWDCSRPAQGSDYCSILHETLALNEGPLCTTPVLRPRGISLKDGALFASLSAKMQGKDVGIPECEGAATKKSPWNAPELFNILFFEGEKIREWLFFDKPRKAFQSGNRIKRSLPDYNGRGWHASRTQAIKEFGGVKKSYYMDPQPLEGAEWHLYEYESNSCDALILFRLELKFVDGKKSPKGKATKDPIADLQNQMGRLTAEFPADNELPVKNKTTFEDGPKNVYSSLKQTAPANASSSYGASAPYSCLQEAFHSHEFNHNS